MKHQAIDEETFESTNIALAEGATTRTRRKTLANYGKENWAIEGRASFRDKLL